MPIGIKLMLKEKYEYETFKEYYAEISDFWDEHEAIKDSAFKEYMAIKDSAFKKCLGINEASLKAYKKLRDRAKKEYQTKVKNKAQEI